jgi:predicted  nucleic acid-binding Zn-ribbon protein
MSEDITARLEGLLEEVRDLIRQRQERIEELKTEIVELEDANEELQKQVSGLFGDLEE